MKEVLNKIQELTIKESEHQDVFTLLAKTAEEMGELATAVLAEKKSFGCNKILSESANYEAVDLAIMAFCVYFANGGSLEDLEPKFQKKLSKWEEKFK